MANILKNPVAHAQRGYNGFDMSQNRIYTAPCGMLLPVYKDFLNPGDKVNINASAYVRTEALQNASFTSFKLHFDWFFVPMPSIMLNWSNFYNGVDKPLSSRLAMTSANSIRLPSCNLYRLASTMIDNAQYAPSSSYIPDNGHYWQPDAFGVPFAYNVLRLIDMFGYGSTGNFINSNDTSNDSWQLLVPLYYYYAYHKIFYEFFCRDNWTAYRPDLYSMDLATMNNDGLPSDGNALELLREVHYRPYRTDFFTNIFPTPSFANTPNTSFSWLLNESGFKIEGQSSPSVNTNDVIPPTPDLTQHDTLQFDKLANFYPQLDLSSIRSVSTSDLRSLFAIDRLLQVTGMTKKDYENQTMAHFGYKIPHDIQHQVIYLGTQVTDINISEVVATATTGTGSAGSVLGDIAGKGFGKSDGQKPLHLTAPTHGILMCLQSIEPIVNYASMSCESVNMLSEPYDFYHPEFDGIGMVPFLEDDFQLFSGVINSHAPREFIGWTYRYYQLKSKFDIVNAGVFDTFRQPWAAFKQDSLSIGDRGHSTLTTIPSRFYISPQYSNGIFLVNFPAYNIPTSNTIIDYKVANVQPSSSDIYDADPFIINAHFNVFKSSIMSTYSLPKPLF